jgi:hypothetical protein
MNRTQKAVDPGVTAGVGGFIGALIGTATELHWTLTGLLAAAITLVWYIIFKYTVPNK